MKNQLQVLIGVTTIILVMSTRLGSPLVSAAEKGVAAVIAVDDEARVNADMLLDTLFTPMSNSVLQNDSGDVTVVSFDAMSEAGATVTMEPDGTFTYDPRSVGSFQALTYW